jgi:transposase
MDHIIRIGMDTSKHVFQLHGVNAAEGPVLRRKLRRNDMVVFFERACSDDNRDRGCGRVSSLGAAAAVLWS